MIKFKIGLIFVFVLALVMRFWSLSVYPIGLTVDEVAIGYGSYSLLTTGRDEWNQVLPITFYSLGDYKPPLIYYLQVPSQFLFGQTEFAVRFSAALLGSASAVLFLLLVRLLKFNRFTAIFSGVWLAVLPWHIYYSRFGTEAIIALFLTLLGLVCLFRGKFFFGLFFLLLTLWTYHSQRLFIPLFLFVSAVIYFNKLKYIFNNNKLKPALVFLAVLLISPFIYLFIKSPEVYTRAAQTSILRDPSLALSLHYGQYSDFLQRIFDSDLYLIWHQWISRYLSYFDIRFWFHSALNLTPPGYPNLGLLFVIDLPLFLFGSFKLLTGKLSRSLTFLILAWFFLGPLPASLTMDDQHTLRSVIWIPAFGLILASGLNFISKKYLPIFTVYALFLIFSVIYFFDLYFVQTPRYKAEIWHYGFKQAALYACSQKKDFDRIIISPTFGEYGPILTGLPEYYVLFFCRIPPKDYLATHKIPKFDFTRIDWHGELKKSDKSLLISARWDYPDTIPPLKNVINRIDFPNGTPHLYFVTNRP